MSYSVIHHKDLFGSIEYSVADGCYFGKILGTEDLVTYEAKTIEGLKDSFVEAVEDYFELCERVGKVPQKMQILTC